MILLDTQVLYWSLTDPSRIRQAAREVMNDRGCSVSAISLVEFRVKQVKGRLHVPDGLLHHITRSGFHLLAFAPEHAEALTRFPELSSHDPFDRMLVAQAHASRQQLLTTDRKLLDLDLPWILDATAVEHP